MFPISGCSDSRPSGVSVKQPRLDSNQPAACPPARLQITSIRGPPFGSRVTCEDDQRCLCARHKMARARVLSLSVVQQLGWGVKVFGSEFDNFRLYVSCAIGHSCVCSQFFALSPPLFGVTLNFLSVTLTLHFHPRFLV